MIDLTVRISLALDANKGAYAVLSDSEVSAAAGIPTGWQIVSDLITKVASLEGADVSGDPIYWYKQRYGVEPDYSGLLNSIANSPPKEACCYAAISNRRMTTTSLSEIRFNDLTSVLKSVG